MGRDGQEIEGGCGRRLARVIDEVGGGGRVRDGGGGGREDWGGRGERWVDGEGEGEGEGEQRLLSV